jgi:hypothetical protein
VKYAAKFYGRTERGIIKRCMNGTFAEAKIPIYKDKSRRWWILIPKEN